MDVHNLSVPIEDFRGWTSLPNPVDMVDLQTSNEIIVAIADGSLRHVSDASSERPRLQVLQSPKGSQRSSLALSEDLRKSFIVLEKTGNRGKNKAPVSSTAGMHLSSFTQLDRGNTVFWTYERYQLDRRLYVMPNLRKMNFAFARFGPGDPEENMLNATIAALTQDVRTG